MNFVGTPPVYLLDISANQCQDNSEKKGFVCVWDDVK